MCPGAGDLQLRDPDRRALGHEQPALHHHAHDVQPGACREAPRRFGELTGRGVPLNSLLLSSLGIALAVVLSVLAGKSSFILMLAISSFGAIFTWMMIFVTHYFFRRAHQRTEAAPLRFRMIGFPFTTLLGAGLMAAVLVTTAFAPAFRMTLVFGIPFLALLRRCTFTPGTLPLQVVAAKGQTHTRGVSSEALTDGGPCHGSQIDSGRIPQRNPISDVGGRRQCDCVLQGGFRGDRVVPHAGRERPHGTHAEIRIGDSVVMLADAQTGAICSSPRSLGGSSVGLMNLSG